MKNYKKVIVFFVATFAFLILGENMTQFLKTENIQTRIQNRGNAIISEGKEKIYKPGLQESDELEEFDYVQNETDEKAKELAKIVTQVEGVDKASVVINHNSVLIGIEVAQDIEDEKLIVLKKTIKEKIETENPEFERVSITASKELVERITNMTDYEEDDSIIPENETIQKLTPGVF